MNGELSRLRVGIKPLGKIIAREGVRIFSQNENQIGSKMCKTCSKGRFQSVAGSETCLNCKVGQHMKSVGAVHCLDCSPGKTTIYTGQTQCVSTGPAPAPSSDTGVVAACGVGQTLGAHNSCKNCVPGKFKAIVSNDQCASCAINTYQNEFGAAACKQCERGSITARL